jgi:hypothetical protein
MKTIITTIAIILCLTGIGWAERFILFAPVTVSNAADTLSTSDVPAIPEYKSYKTSRSDTTYCIDGIEWIPHPYGMQPGTFHVMQVRERVCDAFFFNCRTVPVKCKEDKQ